LELDAQQADQQRYLPLEVDLGQAGAAATDLTLRVTQPASGEAGELFVGEPELVTP
jgi:hypothetical protein